MARANWPESPLDPQLDAIQRDLFEIGAQLASPGQSRFAGVSPDRVGALERAIDGMENELTPLTNDILPGGSLPAANLHVARTICRRAERLVVALGNDAPESTLVYLNRLSDYLFVAARFTNARRGAPDVPWTR